MPDIDFRYLLLAGLAIALAYAAYTDLRSRLIENWLNAGIALTAPLFWWACGLSWPMIGWQLGIAAITFAVLATLFYLRSIGGGDVKLLVALALWFPPLAFFQMLFMASIIGGLMTTLGSWLNLASLRGKPGVAALIYGGGALSLALLSYVGWVLAGGAPINFVGLLGGATAFFALFALVLIMMVVSSLVTARHQRQRLRIPYGVAISVGALWAIAARLLPMLHDVGVTNALR